MVWPSVVFPQPDSPTKPKVSPARTEKETPSTARIVNALPPRRPPPTLKYLVRFSTSRIGRSPAAAMSACAMAITRPAPTQHRSGRPRRGGELRSHEFRAVRLETSRQTAVRVRFRPVAGSLHTWPAGADNEIGTGILPEVRAGRAASLR